MDYRFLPGRVEAILPSCPSGPTHWHLSVCRVDAEPSGVTSETAFHRDSLLLSWTHRASGDGDCNNVIKMHLLAQPWRPNTLGSYLILTACRQLTSLHHGKPKREWQEHLQIEDETTSILLLEIILWTSLDLFLFFSLDLFLFFECLFAHPASPRQSKNTESSICALTTTLSGHNKR